LEGEMAALRRELMRFEYTPGPYREFRVQDGKARLISAAPFRWRIAARDAVNFSQRTQSRQR
jgi:hypothetical protein